MSERKKRRTQSAADVELANQLPEPSPLARRPRVKSSARQARLVAFPTMAQHFYGGMALQNQPNIAMSQPVFQGMGFPQQQMIYPQPQIANNSIIFTLLPQQREIPYSVNIDKMHFPKATLKASGGVRAITFSINNTLFTNAVPPVDLSALIVHGPNFLQFCTFGFQTPIFIEIALEDIKNPDALVEQVMNQFPAAPPIVPDPFANLNCPISHQKIENAGRGVNCVHAQCFDLKNFIKRGIETNCWDCPVCGNKIPFEDLRYDRDYLKQPSIFAISDGDDAGSLFSDLVDRRFDPYDSANMYMDRDF